MTRPVFVFIPKLSIVVTPLFIKETTMNFPDYQQTQVMPQGMSTDQNPELAGMISRNPTFASIAMQLQHERDAQAMRWPYIYPVEGTVVGQTTQPFTITIEQGTDFMCENIAISAFSYDAVNASSFPIPNSLGATAWAGRGLSIQITETRSGRQYTSGFEPIELLGAPGYGLNFQRPISFRTLILRNSKIRFDVRNRDAATRTHAFAISLIGYKILTPQ